jgi:hypothetical protein
MKYVFVVEGEGSMPADMIRYDNATPNTVADAERVEPDVRGMRVVALVSRGKPTVKRWRTFGWAVISCTGLKEGEETWKLIKENVDDMYPDIKRRTDAARS